MSETRDFINLLKLSVKYDHMDPVVMEAFTALAEAVQRLEARVCVLEARASGIGISL